MAAGPSTLGAPCRQNSKAKLIAPDDLLLPGDGGATLRRDLINVAGRAARRGRGHLTVHLPEGWHRQQEWASLFRAAAGPPAAVACLAPVWSLRLSGLRPRQSASPIPAITRDKPHKPGRPGKPSGRGGPVA
jgi:hypothetical protein